MPTRLIRFDAAMAAVFVAVSALLVYRIVWTVLLERNGGVEITAVGLAARDWRGRCSRLRWDQVHELRLPVFKPMSVHGDAPTRIFTLFAKRDEPIEAIVTHGGLTEKREAFWDTRYTRPTQEQPYD